MWKDYSLSYVKNNRSSSVFIIIAAFISALLLSLLCSLFYNLWFYDVQKLKIEEGDWQGRLVGEISTDDLTKTMPALKKLQSTRIYLMSKE